MPLNLAVALVIGVMVAVGVAFLLEYLDKSLKDPKKCKSCSDRSWALFRSWRTNRVEKYQRNTRLITFTDPHSPITEAFRTLRTNIQFAGVDKQVKTMLITGASELRQVDHNRKLRRGPGPAGSRSGGRYRPA